MTKIFQKLSQLGPGQEVETLFMSSLINWWKPLEFVIQSDDYANNGGYDNSDCDSGEFMKNGDPPGDRNERSDTKRKLLLDES